VTSYLDLDDFVETAAELLALSEETVVKMARLDLAESALHAPQAGWGRPLRRGDLPAHAGHRRCARREAGNGRGS
jgi:hypothetical protein